MLLFTTNIIISDVDDGITGQPASSCCQEGWSPFRGSCYMYADWDTTWARAAVRVMSLVSLLFIRE